MHPGPVLGRSGRTPRVPRRRSTGLFDDAVPYGNGFVVLLCGPSGTGKTQQVMGMLKAQDPAQILSATINFNFYTTSAVLGNTMCLPLEKKTGTNFGPPGQAHLVYFVDDLNLPEGYKYMTQSAIALLRQQMEYGHIYDMTKLAQNSSPLIACQASRTHLLMRSE